MSKTIIGSEEQLITIITVVRNGEIHIKETIESVLLAKKKHRIEFIIVDGNSTDDTINIIERYKNAIDTIVSEPDQGIYDAMNKGWKLAKESFVLYLGAGDKIVSLPNIKNINVHKRSVYFGRVLIGNKPYKSGMNYRIRFGNTIHHQALLVYKEENFIEPFDKNLMVYADYDFIARLFKEGYCFVYSEEFESYALPGGLSSKIYIREMLKVIKENFGLVWIPAAIFYHFIQGIKYGFNRYTLE